MAFSDSGDGFTDAIVTRDSETVPLYPRLLGADWSELAPEVRAIHVDGSAGEIRAKGLFTVRHGDGRLVRLLARLLGMPAEGDGVETRLSVVCEGSGERWRRMFAGRRLASVQYESPRGVLAERFGPVELRFRLAAAGGSLRYEPAGASVGLGQLMLPLPTRISPQLSAREEPVAGSGRVRTSVRVVLPVLGLLITYSGEIEPDV